MKKRIIVIASIAALVVAATIFALAQGHPGMQGMHGEGPGKGPGHGEMLEHMARALDLTDAQKQQVKAIMEATESTARDIHAKLEETHKQLAAATANGQFDEAQIRTLANQQGQLEADMTVEHFRAMSKVYAILTPEQRVKAEEMHKQMGPGHRPGQPPPPPGF
ncbi:MAG: Spy/CpxP family protein refolding chaperone [bacterium]